VPIIEEDGFVLFESGAIVLYIGERSEALLPNAVRRSGAHGASLSRIEGVCHGAKPGLANSGGDHHQQRAATACRSCVEEMTHRAGVRHVACGRQRWNGRCAPPFWPRSAVIALVFLRKRTAGRHVLRLCLALLLAGCTSIGPPTLRRDRLDYADALADASKRETLLNIVKLRYADAPSLVTVDQLVAGYTLEGRVDLGSNFFTRNFDFSDDVAVGAGGTFSDRPTVTYTPIKGDTFARVMLTPIPPSELFAMLTTGAAAELTLGLAVQSINGLHNWTADAQGEPHVDREFAEVLALLGALRRDGVLGFRFDTQAGPRTAYLLLEDLAGKALEARARRLLDLLQLDTGVRSFPIRFGFGRNEPTEIRIYTRSLIEILSNLAAQVEVPEDNVAAGRTYPTQPRPAQLEVLPGLVVVSREVRPYQPFVAVQYRGTWYWIDDRDYASKRVFSTLMLLLNLVVKAGAAQLPVITIPTG
jgi:glutathione S-transferase